MEFKNRLKELIEEKNEGSQKKLSLATNIPASTINCWFTKDIKPTYVQIIKLAKYFDVSADYLLGLEDDFGVRTATTIDDGLSNEEREIIKKYRELNVHGKKLVNTAIDTYLATMAESKEKHSTNQNKF